MDGHDPLQFAAELAAKLATRSRHVCAFLGAGVSKACGLPDVADLEKRTLDALEAADRVALTKQLKERNLEQVLTQPLPAVVSVRSRRRLSAGPSICLATRSGILVDGATQPRGHPPLPA